MKKRNKIPTVLGVFLLLIGTFAGVFLLNNNQIFKVGADPNLAPKDVRVSSISDSSVNISWLTTTSTKVFISYGKSQSLGTVVNESTENTAYLTHSILLTGLDPETVYYFNINSNGTNFDNNGIPWQFTTGKNIGINSSSFPVSGSVITASGQPVKRALVYVLINGYSISTISSESGNFVLQLGLARNLDLTSYTQIDPAKTILDISAISETGEISTAKIYPQSANPMPALIIGQDQDFRSLPPNQNGEIPNADLNLPENATVESKFNIPDNSQILPSKNVTLNSVTEGEVITTDKPDFFGSGPVGKTITITVHSDEILSGTTKVTSTGLWNWSIPTNLSPGIHSITLSWIDTSGITQTLTRNFIVQAGEAPAFVATPSATATVTPVPTKTPTPKPTVTASPTPVSTPVATPVITPKPSNTPVATLPQSGSLTPTILLFIMGLGTLIFSFYIWKTSQENI